MRVAARLLPLTPLLVRALALAVLVKALLLALALFAGLASAAPAPERFDGPVGVVLLTAILGAGDIRRRGERLLWANLGYAEAVTTALFAATAIVTEVAWAAT